MKSESTTPTSVIEIRDEIATIRKLQDQIGKPSGYLSIVSPGAISPQSTGYILFSRNCMDDLKLLDDINAAFTDHIKRREARIAKIESGANNAEHNCGQKECVWSDDEIEYVRSVIDPIEPSVLTFATHVSPSAMLLSLSPNSSECGYYFNHREKKWRRSTFENIYHALRNQKVLTIIEAVNLIESQIAKGE